MKRPYLKKYGKISNFTVWIVDGVYVRKFIDEEFTNFGQHYRFNFIPKNEFWIDEEHGGTDEERYFIDHMLVENRLMSEGKSYSFALEKADNIERKERFCSKDVVKLLQKKEDYSDIITKIHKKLLKDYSSQKVKVWVVDGNLVRSFFFIDFTEGGHDKVYNFIPSGEVWLDDDLLKKEYEFVLIHELYERSLMSKGQKYDDAHKSASKLEYRSRQNPKEIKAILERVIKKNNLLKGQ